MAFRESQLEQSIVRRTTEDEQVDTIRDVAVNELFFLQKVQETDEEGFERLQEGEVGIHNESEGEVLRVGVQSSEDEMNDVIEIELGRGSIVSGNMADEDVDFIVEQGDVDGEGLFGLTFGSKLEFNGGESLEFVAGAGR